MGKIKSFFSGKSIKISFTVYMSVCILSAILLGLVLSEICRFGQSMIYEPYEKVYEYGQVARLESTDLVISYYAKDVLEYASPLMRFLYEMLGVLGIAVYPLCFIVGIIITSILFYRREIQQPLEILDGATEKILEDNLNFQITYQNANEFGSLCRSFEKMRLALQENHFDMWRQIEERKRLNAAFSHDLRTPLTVLKGQSEMLSKYAPQMSPEKIVQTAEMMGRHIVRLEKYVNTMHDLQRLEDIDIDRQPVYLSDLKNQLSATGRLICQDKEFQFQLHDAVSEMTGLTLDSVAVIRVYENMLANAARFAKEKITISLHMKNDAFCITVSDDGPGFSDKDLTDATRPFYKTKAVHETDGEHFGMGLNICRIICEKHGGYLELSNHNGAVVTAVFK